MNRWTGKVALVTGASAGIGAQITRSLAENGMKVIAVARRLNKLKELAACLKQECKAEVYPMQCDVQQEADILKVFNWAEEELGGVDVLINNAGAISTEPIIESPTETYRKIMDVNVIAMAICSRELTQSVKRRKASGHIININSIAGHCAEVIRKPINLYVASKYAVTGMTTGLRNEMAVAKLDIKVTSISPGPVETDMFRSVIPTDTVPVLQDKDIADAVIYTLNMPHHVQICEIIVMPHETAWMKLHSLQNNAH